MRGPWVRGCACPLRGALARVTALRPPRPTRRKKISTLITTRRTVQIRTHAQKFLLRAQRAGYETTSAALKVGMGLGRVAGG